MPPVRNFINLPDDHTWVLDYWNNTLFEDVFSTQNSTVTNITNREWSIDRSTDTIVFKTLPISDDRADNNNNIEVASENELLDIINTD